MNDLIQALDGLDLHGMAEAFSRVIESQHSARNPFHNPENADAMTALRELRGLIPILSRYRSSVEGVELPEAEIACAVDEFDLIQDWSKSHLAPGVHYLYTATTVRTLIAQAVERERAACADACEAIEDEYQRTEGHRYPELKSDAEAGAGACASAIRARGNK